KSRRGDRQLQPRHERSGCGELQGGVLERQLVVSVLRPERQPGLHRSRRPRRERPELGTYGSAGNGTRSVADKGRRPESWHDMQQEQAGGWAIAQRDSPQEIGRAVTERRGWPRQ